MLTKYIFQVPRISCVSVKPLHSIVKALDGVVDRTAVSSLSFIVFSVLTQNGL